MADQPSPEIEQLREHLKQLHTELASTETVDPQTQELLTKLQEDIERLQETERSHPDLKTRLADAARHLEATHPTLAGVIRGVGDMLSQSGI